MANNERKKKKDTRKKTATKTTVVTTSTKADYKSKTAVSKKGAVASPTRELTFNRNNYMWMGIGVALIALGMLLMSGGSMPSPDVWDENIIYGFRRITLAPILILAGLIVEIYAIFTK